MDQERESAGYHPVKRVIEKLTLIDKWYNIRKMDITPLTEMDKCIYMWNTVHLGFGECWPLDEELAPPPDEQVYHTVPLSSSLGKYEDPNRICLKMSYISPYFKGSDMLVVNFATEPTSEKSEVKNHSMCEAEGIPDEASSQSVATASLKRSTSRERDNTQSGDATKKPSVGKRGKISSWVKSKLHGKTSKHCQNHDALKSITERKESEVFTEDLQRKACPEGDHHPESNSNQMEIVVGEKSETVQSSQLDGGQGDLPKLFTHEEGTDSATARTTRVVSKNMMEAGDFKLDAESWCTENRKNHRTGQMDCSNSSGDGEFFNVNQRTDEKSDCNNNNNESQSLEAFNKHLDNVEKPDSSCWSVTAPDVEASGSEKRDLPISSVAETVLPMPDVVPGIDVSPCDEVIPSETNKIFARSLEENELNCSLIAQKSDDQIKRFDRLVHDETSVHCNNEDIAKLPIPVSSRTTLEDASVTDPEPRDLINIAVAILKSVDVAMAKTDSPSAEVICIPRNFSSSKIEASLRALKNLGRANLCLAAEANGMHKESFSQTGVDVKEMEAVESDRSKSTSTLSLAKMARTVGTQWPEQDAEVLVNNCSPCCRIHQESFEGKDVSLCCEDTSGDESQSMASCSKDVEELEGSQATRKTNKRFKPKRKNFLGRFLSSMRFKKVR